MDLGRTFDIESLSMSLKTNSFFRKNNVPLDTLTGMRIRSARTAIGTKIFKLQVQGGKKKVQLCIDNKYIYIYI